MKITRRTFLKGTGGLGGAFAASRFFTRGSSLAETAAKGGASPAGVEDFVPTTCWIGKQDCGMLARRIDGRVVKLEGHPAHPLNLGTLCPKGQAQIMSLYDPNRVRTPMLRTNAKGQEGQWRRISWDEALEMVGEKVNEARAKDPSLVMWQKGRSKAKDFYDDAFVDTLEAVKVGHGGYCSDAGYRASEYTVGLHGVLHPDFRHTQLLLSWGWNATGGGGNKLCQLTWPRQMIEAKERGMKIVAIDPRIRAMGPHVDKWLPIRPGTDLALSLALANVLIEGGYVDEPYLRQFTNSTFLVGEDGFFLRIDGKEAVLDDDSGEAVPHDADGITPTLGPLGNEGGTGTSVNGQLYRPAYQVYKEHVAQYPPEWAADVTGLEASDIRELATEMGETAAIGSTTEIDGVEIPLRPVSAMAYHMSQQELGFQALRGMWQVFMLLGAVGAVGGLFSDFEWKLHDGWESLDTIEIKDPPYDVLLKDSKFYPINTKLPGIYAQSMLDPAKHGVGAIPEVAILHMVNPVPAFADTEAISRAYERFKFVAAITPWMSETADRYADVVLPAATLEKYEGPMKPNDQYRKALALRVPVMEPLYESKGEIDIYLDLTEKMGLLTGEGGYLSFINEHLELEGEFALPLDQKPTVREIFDRWAKSQGIEEGVEFFETSGVKDKGPVPVTSQYGYVTDPPFLGALHRFYGESLLRYQGEMRAKGAEEIYWQDYTPLPTWRSPTMDGSPAEYDLYLISYKLMEHKQARTSFVPLLAELSGGQRLEINPATADAKGISEGDEVVVESHNAVTGETRSLTTRARLTEVIRPDTVGMPHHFGLWTHPWSRGQGPSPNQIFFTGEGYVTNTADQSFHVKVKVARA